MRRRGDEQFGIVILRQCRDVAAAVSVKIKCLALTEVVAFALAPFAVTLRERLFTNAADAFTVPKGHDKVHPFLVAVRTLRAGEQLVHPRKSLIGQGNEIVLQRHDSFHVQIVLA